MNLIRLNFPRVLCCLSLLFFSSAELEAQVTLDSVEALHRAARLNWSIFGNQSPASFRLYRSTSATSGFQAVQQSPGADRVRFDYWLTNEVTYYYRVAAVDENGNESSPSNTKAGTPSAQPPAIYSITPEAAANDAIVHIRDISGINFAPEDTVKLTQAGSPDILGQETQIRGPDQIVCSFDLRARAPGKYHLTIVRSDTATVLENVFTINPARLRFTEVSEAVGLRPNNFLSFGSAWGDFDNDGRIDLFVANGTFDNQLFHNQSRDEVEVFKPFVNPGGLGQGDVAGVAWIDYDNDGDLELFLSSLGGSQSLFENLLAIQNQLQFDPIGERVGLLDPVGPCIHGASWADYDQDGLLDLYISLCNKDGVDQLNRLYRQRDGKLAPIDILTSGIDTRGDASFSPVWADYDNDGDPDLYMCNGGSNRLYCNRGNGTFEEIAARAGVDYGNHTENATWGDYDNDGNLDLYLVNTNDAPNVLYRNNGDGTFADVTPVPLNDAGYGFAAAWGDYDNDGDLDLFLARGGYREEELGNLKGQPNRLFENRGLDQFEDVAEEREVADSLVAVATIWGDYNNDGFLDLFVAVRDTRSVFISANKLYRNSGGNGNKWVKVLLEGVISNRAGIGARIELQTGGKKQIREINGGDGRSHGGVIAHFGLGQTGYDAVKVRWPSGVEQTRRTNLDLNDTLWMKEPSLPAPDSLRAEPGNGQIHLRWADNRRATDIVAFRLYRGTRPDFHPDSVELVAPPINGVQFTDAPVQNDVFYTYWIRGIDASDNLGQRSAGATAKALTLCSGLVGDFVPPCEVIDVEDLTKFAEAFRQAGKGAFTNALLPFDIGPASGAPPQLIPQRDGKIDFEDLVVFVQMWRWSLQQSSPEFSDHEEFAAYDATVEIAITHEDRQKGLLEYALKLKTPTAIRAAQFDLHYDEAAMALQELALGKEFIADDAPALLLEHRQNDAGSASVMAYRNRSAPLEWRVAPFDSGAVLLKAKFLRRPNANPRLTIAYKTLDERGGAKRQGMVTAMLETVPDEIVLLPNYPNPFNPSTIIQFGLHKRLKVRLTVINLLGQEVATLVDEEKPPGFHRVTWNGKSDNDVIVSAGIYLYRLETSGLLLKRKLLYLR